ncbi:MAG TPA: MBL fold metallo-hydrolase [Acidimicrobiia bacterium]|jgi:phosphoribosyl 1,2-cyclic phosphodiesterase|nr:MBL fold metallo-hydrolase [Acidimicrobiia bacterium]
MSGGIRVRFNGVRGSTPCAGEAYTKYGGNSSCVALEADNAQPIIFDLGTGLRPYGVQCDGDFHGAVLLTHLHWDHVQGLPFFTPMHRESSSLDVYGPRQADGPLGDVFTAMMRPPHFPITPAQLAGDVRFHDTGDDDFPIGVAKVRSRWVRHVGPTLGFRVDWNGVSVAYIPDHGPGCCPEDPDDYVPQEMLELCDGVDVLIHDAQHTHEEYGPKRHWGHCTIEYAVHVARESGARKLVLFHHDPSHGDAELDRIEVCAQDHSAHLNGPEVCAAYEGLELAVAPIARRAQ